MQQGEQNVGDQHAEYGQQGEEHQERAGQILVERLQGAEQHRRPARSEEHTSELQSLMRISYAVFCLKKKKKQTKNKQKSHKKKQKQENDNINRQSGMRHRLIETPTQKK